MGGGGGGVGGGGDAGSDCNSSTISSKRTMVIISCTGVEANRKGAETEWKVWIHGYGYRHNCIYIYVCGCLSTANKVVWVFG